MKTIEHLPKEKRKFLPNLERSEPYIQDSTIYREWINCKRRYFFRFVLGRTLPVDKNQQTLDFGSHYHKFQEILELKGYSEAMNYILKVKLPILDPSNKWVYLDDRRLLKTCQTAYEEWKKEKALGKIETIAVEQPLNIEILPGFHIGGRADKIVKWNGNIYGRDYKTTSKDKATFQKGLNPNDQAIRYFYLESELHGKPIKGIMFDVVYNVKTIGPQFYTLISSRNPWEVDQWLAEIKYQWSQLEWSRENDIWPMETHNCAWCQFRPVCAAGNPVSMENMLRSEYKYQPWDHTKVDEGE